MTVIVSINEVFKKVQFTELAGEKIDVNHWMNSSGTSSQISVTKGIAALKNLYNVSKSYALETINFGEVLSENDYLVFNCHGSVFDIENYNVEQLFFTMTKRGYKKCKEIHFYACSIGSGVMNFSQSLANYADVRVYAPADTLYLDSTNGTFFVKGYKSDCGWNVFEPSLNRTSDYVSWKDANEGPPYERAVQKMQCVIF